MNNPFELGEYSKLYPDEHSKSLDDFRRSTVDSRLNLELSTDDETSLKNELKGIIKIETLKEGLKISTNSHIGVANFDSFSVVVQPKILMDSKNLFGMINYVYNSDIKLFSEYTPKFGDEFLVDVIITSFVDQCKNLLKIGLYKSYVTHQDNLAFLRGKLRVKQHLQNVLKNKPQFACEHDELEYDNLENRIILFCLRRSYQLTRNDDIKKDIRKLMYQISTVVSDKYITRHDFTKINLTRQNYHYQNIIDICKLIIESPGIAGLFSDRNHLVNSFFVDMNMIFEKFVFKLFAKVFADKYIVAKQKENKVWNIDDEKTMGIRTDILLKNKNGDDEIVIDTKYKTDITISDLYQIGFYVHEYSQKGSKNEQKVGYAILPKQKDTLQDDSMSKQSLYVTEKQRITVVKSFLDIDKAVSLLYSQEPTANDDLKQMMIELLKV